MLGKRVQRSGYLRHQIAQDSPSSGFINPASILDEHPKAWKQKCRLIRYTEKSYLSQSMDSHADTKPAANQPYGPRASQHEAFLSIWRSWMMTEIDESISLSISMATDTTMELNCFTNR